MGMKVTWPTPERLELLRTLMATEPSTDKILDRLADTEGPGKVPDDWPKLVKWCNHWGYERPPELRDPKVVKNANIAYRRLMGRPLTGVRRDVDPEAAKKQAPQREKKCCAACGRIFERKSKYVIRCDDCRSSLARFMDFG